MPEGRETQDVVSGRANCVLHPGWLRAKHRHKYSITAGLRLRKKDRQEGSVACGAVHHSAVDSGDKLLNCWTAAPQTAHCPHS